MRHSLFASLALLCLAGCATAPVATEDAAPVPAERMLDARLAQPAADRGVVVVKRDTGIAGAGCWIRVFVDGKPAADLGPAERVDLHVPAGRRIVSATPGGGGLCGLPGQALVETSVDAVVGARTMLRVGYTADLQPVIQPTAF